MVVLSIIMGIIMIIGGIISIANPLITALVIGWLFGIVLLVNGICMLINGFRGHRSVLNILVGILSIIAGGAVLFNYFGGLIANEVLIILLAVTLLVTGIIKIAQAVSLKGTPGWGLILVVGIIAIFVSILVFANMAVGFLIIDVMIAVTLITHGLEMIFCARSVD